MRLPWRRAKPATDAELQSAHNWNKWGDHHRELWEAIDDIPGGHPDRARLVRKACRLSDAMWQMDPPMWEAVARTWPKRWRDRRLS